MSVSPQNGHSHTDGKLSATKRATLAYSAPGCGGTDAASFAETSLQGLCSRLLHGLKNALRGKVNAVSYFGGLGFGGKVAIDAAQAFMATRPLFPLSFPP